MSSFSWTPYFQAIHHTFAGTIAFDAVITVEPTISVGDTLIFDTVLSSKGKGKIWHTNFKLISQTFFNLKLVLFGKLLRTHEVPRKVMFSLVIVSLHRVQGGSSFLTGASTIPYCLILIKGGARHLLTLLGVRDGSLLWHGQCLVNSF